MRFDPVDPRQSFPELEKGILQFWREEDVFQRSVKHRAESESFSFYDGPPFATGLPHYGHLLAGTIKDVIPRYQTMRGKYVERRFGWDCHGLPVEYEIEKENDIKSKKEIEEMGVEAFNKLCRAAVLRYSGEWRRTVERMGRWVDMDWDYRTMDPDYMESIWWVFGELHKKGLLYEGHTPMHLCPRCVTPLSNFEVTQGYKDVIDHAVTVKFRLKDETEDHETFVLAWTTTPWTLPGNLFLAVHPEIAYVRVTLDGTSYIVADARKEAAFKAEDLERATVESVDTKELIGKRYTPLFPYFAEEYEGTAFRITEGSFVTTEEGTGVVHIAPGFGEDDYRVGKREGVALLQHVTPEGTFIPAVRDFAGMHVKPAEDTSATDRKIIAHLKAQRLVFDDKTYKHSYPHCWRCDSPLLNYATSSWFVAVEKLKKDMLKANKKTEWVPAHIRDGRFGKWLEGARDWSISRNRYWGTPLPVWRCEETGETTILASRDDLMERVPESFTKLSVVRHAQSQGNVEQIYQGKVPGTDLTDTGRKQARATAEEVSQDRLPVTAIYCSPLNRTRQTAEALAEETGARLIVDERLREVEFGEYEGTHISFDDLTFVKERRAHKMEKNQVESIYHFEGMETWGDIEKRCRSFLDDVLPRHRGEHIAVVTHADLVMNFTHIFTNEDKHKIVHQPYPPLAGRRTFYWNHDREEQLDLHKETVDGIGWPTMRCDASTSLTLVRHGQTDWNKEGLCQGQEEDRPLTERGREQAHATAQKLKEQSFDGIITSDLARARETADILSKELSVPILEMNSLLRERKFGAWVGKKVADILEEHPLITESGEFAMHHESPPNGETLSEFLQRMREAREHLSAMYPGKKLLVVCHGGVIQGFSIVVGGMPYRDAVGTAPENASVLTMDLHPLATRIPDVLDCWFESGAMPYAQVHWPFSSGERVAGSGQNEERHVTPHPPLTADRSPLPPGFPADFIAEGLDQTRGWFYTLTVLGTALFEQSPFENVIVNGIVLAEDGKKMSKRLKNYPEPTEIVEKYGADAIRFALMQSPAVRGEDLRFSEKYVEEKLRNVLLPLWNSYSFFVTYANAAQWEPSVDAALNSAKKSKDPLDAWIVAKTQELANAMTDELDRYDLSATCDRLAESIDSLTNWYIRLSRRRFAGKDDGQAEAFDTLYRVLVTLSKLLAPFCPFITEAMYVNLVPGTHHSVHLTDWPEKKALTKKQCEDLERMESARTVVTLGLHLRSEAKIKIRQPLTSVTVALPPHHDLKGLEGLIREELNVKRVDIAADPATLGEAFLQVDARKVGPRLGSRVQEVIRAAKAGDFTGNKDGTVTVLDVTLSPDEATLVYRGREGENVAGEHGIVVSLDTAITEELKLEGFARDIIRAVQKLRKDAGLQFTDPINLSLEGADDAIAMHGALINEETRSKFGANDGLPHDLRIDDRMVTVRFEKA